MDHIPLPKNPTIGRKFRIPFLMTEEYDGGDYSNYLSRNKWEILPDPLGEDHVIWTRHGIQATPLEVAGMFQTWQFLGYIWAALGLLNFEGPIPAHYDEFTKCSSYKCTDDDGGSYLTTEKLNTRLCFAMRDYVLSERFMKRYSVKLSKTKRVEQYVSELREYATVSSKLRLSLMWPKKYFEECIEAQLVAFSIGLLTEQISVFYYFIMDQCVKSEMGQKDAHAPLIISQLGGSQETEGDLARPLLETMRQYGWCPRMLDSLHRKRHMDSLTVLWFFANMKPPLSDKSHEECGIESCRHSITSPEEYAVRHQSSGCDCNMIGLNPTELRSIIDKGDVPLVEIQVNVKIPNRPPILRALRASAASRFIAISHVWQDGHGNQSDNTLPSCFINYIARLCRQVLKKSGQFPKAMRKGGNGVEGFYIWMDTLCVPREPLLIRRKALGRLRAPFEMAEHVIALDSFLATVDSKSMFITDMIGRVLISRWVQRLWTYQEGFLAKRLWFKFKDDVEELAPRATDLCSKGHLMTPTHAYAHINITILEMYGASNIIRDSKLDDHARRLSTVHRNICERRTSIQSDEALCLASIFDIELTPITGAEEGLRMYLFWMRLCQSGKVPCGIIFSRATTKLTRKGFRWCPSTLMRSSRDGLWTGYGDDGISSALLSKDGLVVSFPSYRLQATAIPEGFDLDKSPFALTMWYALQLRPDDLDFYLKDGEGNWYVCWCLQPWHQLITSSQPEVDYEISIILHRHDMSPSSGLYFPTNLCALMIIHQTNTPIGSNIPVYGTVYHHLAMSRINPEVKEYYDYILSAVESYYTSGACKNSQCHDASCIQSSFLLHLSESYSSFIKDNERGLELCILANELRFIMADQESLKGGFMGIARKMAYFWPNVRLRHSGIVKWCLD